MNFAKVKLITVAAATYWNGGAYCEEGDALLNPVTGEVSAWGLGDSPEDASEDDREDGFQLDGHYIKVGAGPNQIELKLDSDAEMVQPSDCWQLSQFMSPDFCSFLDATTVADAIQCPLAKWPGQCFAIASQLVKAYRLKGTAVYGMFVGKIDLKSHFGHRQHGLTQHGWIRMKSGVLVDPTRWVFEAVKPYIFVTTDTNHSDYDEGANTALEIAQVARQNSGLVKKGNDIAIPKGLQVVVSKLLNDSARTGISASEAFAVANTPLKQLGSNAKAVYAWLAKANLKALIPIDNRKRILGS